MSSRAPATAEEKERMRHLYVELEFSLAEIARLLGFRSETAIKDHLCKMGVTMRPRGRRRGTVIVPAREVQQAVFLYTRMNLSINQIGKVMGMGYSSVRDRLLHGDVTLRDMPTALRLRGHYRPEDHPRRPDGPFVRKEAPKWASAS